MVDFEYITILLTYYCTFSLEMLDTFYVFCLYGMRMYQAQLRKNDLKKKLMEPVNEFLFSNDSGKSDPSPKQFIQEKMSFEFLGAIQTRPYILVAI